MLYLKLMKLPLMCITLNAWYEIFAITRDLIWNVRLFVILINYHFYCLIRVENRENLGMEDPSDERTPVIDHHLSHYNSVHYDVVTLWYYIMT